MRAIIEMAPGVLLCCGLMMVGSAVARWAGLPMPGAALGLLVYLGWLLTGRGIAWSRPGAALLLRWLGAMVVPALVGLQVHAGVLGGATLAVAGILVVTTLVTALATAALYRLMGGRGL